MSQLNEECRNSHEWQKKSPMNCRQAGRTLSLSLGNRDHSINVWRLKMTAPEMFVLNLRLLTNIPPYPCPGIDSSNRDNASQVAEMSCNVTGEVALIVFSNINWFIRLYKILQWYLLTSCVLWGYLLKLDFKTRSWKILKDYSLRLLQHHAPNDSAKKILWGVDGMLG